MTEYKIIAHENHDGSIIETVVWEENGAIKGMLKEVFDAQQVEHLTEIPTPPAE